MLLAHIQQMSERGRAGNLLLFMLPKHHGPCILSSRLQKATVTKARNGKIYVLLIVLKGFIKD